MGEVISSIQSGKNISEVVLGDRQIRGSIVRFSLRHSEQRTLLINRELKDGLRVVGVLPV